MLVKDLATSRLDTSCYYSDEEDHNELDPLNPESYNGHDPMDSSVYSECDPLKSSYVVKSQNEKCKLMLNLTHIDAIDFADE